MDMGSFLLSGPGVFMLNLVCRNLALRKSVLEHLNVFFPTILSKKIEGDVNEVLLCFHRGNKTSEAACILPSLNQAAKRLQSTLCFTRTGTTNSSPHIDITEALKDLKVV